MSTSSIVSISQVLSRETEKLFCEKHVVLQCLLD